MATPITTAHISASSASLPGQGSPHDMARQIEAIQRALLGSSVAVTTNDRTAKHDHGDDLGRLVIEFNTREEAGQALKALRQLAELNDRLKSLREVAKSHVGSHGLALGAQASELTACEIWGWAIVDKNGDKHTVRPRRSDFFGAVNHEAMPFDADDLASADRECSGVAPHRIVTLYTLVSADSDATSIEAVSTQTTNTFPRVGT